MQATKLGWDDVVFSDLELEPAERKEEAAYCVPKHVKFGHQIT